jgi:hypothetical protein
MIQLPLYREVLTDRCVSFSLPLAMGVLGAHHCTEGSSGGGRPGQPLVHTINIYVQAQLAHVPVCPSRGGHPGQPLVDSLEIQVQAQLARI